MLRYYLPHSDCVVIITVLCIRLAAALVLRVVAGGVLCQRTTATALISVSVRARMCVYVFARAGSGCVCKRHAIHHCSLSLEEPLCHRAPCITEHQPYTKLASGQYVGQAGNDEADKHRGELVDDERQAGRHCA